MAIDIVYLESCSHYATGDLSAKWTNVSGGITVAPTGGPRGAGAITGNGSSGQYVMKTLGATAAWAVYFSCKLTALPGGTAGTLLCALTDVGQNQVDLRVRADGTLAVTRNGTVLATSTAAVNAGEWNHFEFIAAIGTAAGFYTAGVNGATAISGAGGANTQATANATANGVAFGTFAGDTNGGWSVADVFVEGAAATGSFTAAVPWAVVALMPDAAGDLAGFTPSSGQNYQRVQGNPPAGDSSYVESSTSGTADLYGFANLPGTVSVGAVQVVVDARRSADGTANLATLIRSGSTTATGATVGLGTNYGMQATAYLLNPATGTGFTQSDVNSLQAGQKVV